MTDQPDSSAPIPPAPVKGLVVPPSSPLSVKTDWPLWKVWLCGLVLVILCLWPMSLGLGASDTTRTMEKISLTSSAESWRNLHEGKPDAFLIPTWNGRERVNKPPMLVWLNMLVWADLDPVNTSPDILVQRSRWLALMLVVVMLLSIYWMGWHLGDFKLAVLSLLVAGTMFGLMRQARFASYDTHLGAWVALSIVGAIWAMRPLTEEGKIWIALPGVLVGGLGLGLAILTKGPIAFLMSLLPMVLIWLLAPYRRWSGLILIGIITGLGVLIAVPWYSYILLNVQQAASTQSTEWGASRAAYISPLNYVLFLVKGTLPWGLWLIAGLLLWLLRGKNLRSRQFAMPLLWFLVVFVIMCIPAAKQDRYLFPLFPVLALLVAQVWREHEWQREQGGLDPGAGLLIFPHWIGLMGASIALPLFILMQEKIIAWEIGLKEIILDGLDPMHVVLVGLGMLVASTIGLWLHLKRWQPFRAGLISAFWSILCFSLVLPGYSNSINEVNPARASALSLFMNEQIKSSPMHYLYLESQDLRPTALFEQDPERWAALPLEQKYYRDVQNLEPNEEFLFYAGRQIHAMSWKELATQQVGHYLLVRRPVDEKGRTELWSALGELGYQPIRALDDDHHPSWANFDQLILFKRY